MPQQSCEMCRLWIRMFQSTSWDNEPPSPRSHKMNKYKNQIKVFTNHNPTQNIKNNLYTHHFKHKLKWFRHYKSFYNEIYEYFQIFEISKIFTKSWNESQWNLIHCQITFPTTLMTFQTWTKCVLRMLKDSIHEFLETRFIKIKNSLKSFINHDFNIHIAFPKIKDTSKHERIISYLIETHSGNKISTLFWNFHLKSKFHQFLQLGSIPSHSYL